MTPQDRHPRKEVEKALSYAEEHGWEIEKRASGHSWGALRCGGGCLVWIYSTPKSADDHAKRIRQAVDKCPHLTPGKGRRKEMAEEYSFTLIIEGDVDSKIEALFEAGCDDATFGEVGGINYGDFDRQAPDFAEAIVSAITDVESVGGLRVARVEPEELVTLSDIATRFGRSKESIRLYISGERGPGGFPAPVSHLRRANRLWRWAEVITWWERASGGKSEEEIDAHLIGALNAVLELRARVESLPEDTRELLSSLEPLGG